MSEGKLPAQRAKPAHLVGQLPPCLPRDPAAPSQQCEATGKKDATCWRLTSPVTPAILGGVGCARGGSTLIEGCLGHGERLQPLPVTSSLLAEHISGERRSCLPRPSSEIMI